MNVTQINPSLLQAVINNRFGCRVTSIPQVKTLKDGFLAVCIDNSGRHYFVFFRVNGKTVSELEIVDQYDQMTARERHSRTKRIVRDLEL